MDQKSAAQEIQEMIHDVRFSILEMERRLTRNFAIMLSIFVFIMIVAMYPYT